MPFAPVALALILFRWFTELWLNRLNQRHVRSHAHEVPRAYVGVIDDGTYRKSVDYTLARARLAAVSDTWDAICLVAILFSGLLPWAFQAFVGQFGDTVWSMAGFLFVCGLGLSLPGLPFDWYAQFRLEERFGFNTTTARTWLLDRGKGLLLAFVLGFPLLVLILKVIAWAGDSWWIWAWGIFVTFQFLILLLAPAVIMPFFNKFTPLAEGPLRERLFGLASRVGFPTRSIDIMDGSKRSRHSNAFFTGFGRFRRIVLFDTLVAQLSAAELEAVLAHEIGHYKKRHIFKLMSVSIVTTLAAFAAVAWLAKQVWFYDAFGFAAPASYGPSAIVPAMLLFALLGGTVSYWLTPLVNVWSRRFEYEADGYASEVMGEGQSLVGALRKLNEKNLSNLTPHPLYSGFHYSHPTLSEREEAVRKLAPI